jgi:hypothetical protein
MQTGKDPKMKKPRIDRFIVLISSIGLAGFLLVATVVLATMTPQSATANAAQQPPGQATPTPKPPLSGEALPSLASLQADDGLDDAGRAVLQLDGIQGPGGMQPAAISINSPLMCDAPIVLNGSIVTGTNPQMTGRLVRNGLPSTCGDGYTCSGVQSTSTKFSYQKFDFINSAPDWQCVDVQVDARSCTQQVYSAAYQESFDPANLCTNIQGAMGFSTSGLYGYSFLAAPGTGFSIVNNTTGIVPPSSNCANYTMTVSLCSSTPVITAKQGVNLPGFTANNLGKVTVQVPVVFQNSGNFTGAASAATVTETVNISVRDGKPAAVNAEFGKAGAVVAPGKTLTQTIPLSFSGSPFQCVSRFFTVNNLATMNTGIYYCNGTNPPADYVVTGSVLPNDTFDEDSYAFQSMPGTRITITVDTISVATAFDPKACVSATPNGPCLPGFQGDNNFICTFPPPNFSGPRFGGLLPDDTDGDNIYYVRINSGSGASGFAGPTGDYRASILVTEGPTGACKMVPVQDNGIPSFVTSFALPSRPEVTIVPSTTITVTTTPIQIMVPPSDPTNPGCGILYLPIVNRK